MKYIIAILILMTGCTFPFYIVPPDPLPINTDTIPPPPDTSPLQFDTVCQFYDPVLLPEFISAYCILDDLNNDYRIVTVGIYKDTILPSEDIQITLETLTGLYYPQYDVRVHVNDNDPRLISIIIKGTNHLPLLTGKITIQNEHAKYHFGTGLQSLMVAGAMTGDELLQTMQEFNSFRIINWYGMQLDSLEYIHHAWVALDTLNCKGGRYWFQTEFNTYEMIQEVIDYAEFVGWENVETVQDDPYVNFGIIDLTGRSVNEFEINYWLNKGYAVKTRS